jgi:hypothetical protein
MSSRRHHRNFAGSSTPKRLTDLAVTPSRMDGYIDYLEGNADLLLLRANSKC